MKKKEKRPLITKEAERVGRIAIIAFVAAIAVLFLIIVRSNRNLSLQVQENYRKISQLEDSIADEKERGAQIEQLRLYMQTDEYAQLQARIRLGMVKANELLFEEVRR